YGAGIESLLSSGFFRTLAAATPGLVSVALQPPISVEDVAGAAVNAALGKVQGREVADHDAIVSAARL
ncbi:hypothetical protein TeGR_g350, partial [Tetraparma gracilis]